MDSHQLPSFCALAQTVSLAVLAMLANGGLVKVMAVVRLFLELDLLVRIIFWLVQPSAPLATPRPLEISLNLFPAQVAAALRVVEARGTYRVANEFFVRAAAFPYLLGNSAHGGW